MIELSLRDSNAFDMVYRYLLAHITSALIRGLKRYKEIVLSHCRPQKWVEYCSKKIGLHGCEKLILYVEFWELTIWVICLRFSSVDISLVDNPNAR